MAQIPGGKTAVIAGASGLVGGHCLTRLLDSPRYSRVVSVSRHALDTEHPKLEQRIVSFDTLPDFEPMEDAEVFCALGTTIKKAGSEEAFRKIDLEYPLRLAQQTHLAGAAQYVLVSSVGADAKSKVFYLRVKGELEEALEAIGFEALHIFRPSFLLGQRTESRFRERAFVPLAKVLGPLLPGEWRKYRPAAASDVAEAMVAAARSGAEGVWVHEWDDISRLASAGSRTI
jgi:uncharacterized protein YbjT (DUF2867 family)